MTTTTQPELLARIHKYEYINVWLSSSKKIKYCWNIVWLRVWLNGVFCLQAAQLGMKLGLQEELDMEQVSNLKKKPSISTIPVFPTSPLLFACFSLRCVFLWSWWTSWPWLRHTFRITLTCRSVWSSCWTRGAVQTLTWRTCTGEETDVRNLLAVEEKSAVSVHTYKVSVTLRGWCNYTLWWSYTDYNFPDCKKC